MVAQHGFILLFVRVKTGSSPNCYFEQFVRKDSEEDIETDIFI